MRNFTSDQADEVVPPCIVHSQASPGNTVDTRVEGQVIALSVDGTSRGYDISGLLWQGLKAGKAGDFNKLFLSIQCESNDVYFLFDSAAVGVNGIDDTQVIAAGQPLVLPVGVGSAPKVFPPAHMPLGLTSWDMTITSQTHKTLIVKCASGKAATLRMWASSCLEPGAT